MQHTLKIGQDVSTLLSSSPPGGFLCTHLKLGGAYEIQDKRIEGQWEDHM